jgi:hypothetical protein
MEETSWCWDVRRGPVDTVHPVTFMCDKQSCVFARPSPAGVLLSTDTGISLLRWEASWARYTAERFPTRVDESKPLPHLDGGSLYQYRIRIREQVGHEPSEWHCRRAIVFWYRSSCVLTSIQGLGTAAEPGTCRSCVASLSDAETNIFAAGTEAVSVAQGSKITALKCNSLRVE